jgi:hypothetical protein
MLDHPLELEALVRDPNAQTMRGICRCRELRPTKEFVRELATVGTSLGYPVRSQSDAFGFVVVSPTTLRPHIEALRLDGVVSEIREFREAPTVWL